MEYLSQPIGELLSTTPAKVIAGIVLWYLTGGIWWTKSVAANFADKELKRGGSDNMVGFMPIIFVFSIVAMPVYYLFKGIGFTWHTTSMMLLTKEARKRYHELNG